MILILSLKLSNLVIVMLFHLLFLGLDFKLSLNEALALGCLDVFDSLLVFLLLNILHFLDLLNLTLKLQFVLFIDRYLLS